MGVSSSVSKEVLIPTAQGASWYLSLENSLAVPDITKMLISSFPNTPDRAMGGRTRVSQQAEERRKGKVGPRAFIVFGGCEWESE